MRGLLALFSAVLLAAPVAAQPAEPPDPDEDIVLTRPSDDDDDEDIVLTRPTDDDDDEGIVLTRPGGAAPAAPAVEIPPRVRFGGWIVDRYSTDTVHEGRGEDVFDNRLKADLYTDIRFLDGTRVFLEGRLVHAVVGENAGDNLWYLFNSRNVKSRARVELREAFVYFPNRLVNVRIGNQVVRWGAGQFQKPTDVLNPTDFSEGLMNDLEAPQIPVPMVHLDRSFGPVNIAAVWIPFFVPNRVNIFGQDFSPVGALAAHPELTGAAGVASLVGTLSELMHPTLEDRIQPILSASDPPKDDLSGSQAGTRIQGRFGPVDLGLTYFFGWDKFPTTQLNTELMGTVGGLLEDAQTVMGFYAAHPEFLAALTGIDLEDPATLLGMAGLMGELAADPEAAAQFYATMDAMGRLVDGASAIPTELTVNDVFRTSFRRQHLLGFDLAAVLFGEVGLTFNTAWSPRRTVYLQSPAGFPQAIRKGALSYSLGVDWHEGGWLDILAEWYQFFILGVEDGEELFMVDEMTSMVTLAVRMRFLEFDALELQLAGMLEVHMLNWFAFPSIAYKIDDAWRVAAGAMLQGVFPGGDAGGPAGLFDHNDSLWIEGKFTF